MCADRAIGIFSFYLNVQRVAGLIGDARVQAVVQSISALGDEGQERLEKNAAYGRLDSLLSDYLSVTQTPGLPVLLAGNALSQGQLFTYLGDFHCQGMSARDVTRRANGTRVDASIRADLSRYGLQGKLEYNYQPTNLTCDTAYCYLSGHQRLFTVGIVQSASSTGVIAVPIAIGILKEPAANAFSSWPESRYGEVFVDSIDSFSKVENEPQPAESELVILKDISENDIICAIGDILGDPQEPAHWAGEECDLFTTAVRVQGIRRSTAFVCKGPSWFHELKIADLGTNGDQVLKLRQTPAELLVLQHCHKVSPAVHKHVRVYATADLPQTPRLYCVIDGYDTLRLLRAYGKCGQNPSS